MVKKINPKKGAKKLTSQAESTPPPPVRLRLRLVTPWGGSRTLKRSLTANGIYRSRCQNGNRICAPISFFRVGRRGPQAAARRGPACRIEHSLRESVVGGTTVGTEGEGEGGRGPSLAALREGGGLLGEGRARITHKHMPGRIAPGEGLLRPPSGEEGRGSPSARPREGEGGTGTGVGWPPACGEEGASSRHQRGGERKVGNRVPPKLRGRGEGSGRHPPRGGK